MKKEKNKNLLTIVGASFIAVLAKFKLAFLFLFKILGFIKIGWIFSSFGSIFVSLWLYTMLYGWPFAITLIILLYIHEMGHFIWMKALGLNPKAPMFLPGLGAYVAMTNTPKSQKDSAWVAMAGPLIGGLFSALTMWLGIKTDSNWLIKSASMGFYLNLFQLIPAKPFDGGFVVESFARWLLLPGSILLFLVSLLTHSGLLLIIAFISVFQTFMSRKFSSLEITMQPTNLSEKITISFAYISLLLMLSYLSSVSNNF